MSDENPTLPYPDARTEHPTLVLPKDRVEPAPRRRARRPWVLLVVLLVLAALVVAAELVARAVLPGIVRGVVIEQLELPADQQLEVDASGILLPQLIAGRLDRLHLSSDEVTIGGVTGAADVTATGVPLRGGDLRDANGTVRIGEDQFAALVDRARLPIESIELDAPDVTASGSIEVFGVGVPLALTATPSADAGDLMLDPVRLRIGELTLDADDIGTRFGPIGEQLTEPQRICVADQLPAGLTLRSVEVVGDEVVVGLDVDGRIVTDPALQEDGECP